MRTLRVLLMFCFILLSMLPFARAEASEPVLRYATLLGGAGYDAAGAVAIDADRSTWIGGFTSSSDFPTIGDDGLAGSADAFLMKLDASGRPIVSLIIGGSGFDEIIDLAIDGAGNVYAAGFTESSNFPTTAGALQSMFGGGPSGQKHDAVVVKLDREGNLVYATYLGGSKSDRAFGIAADASGRAIVVGETASDDFPVTSGAVQSARAGGFDQFIVRLSPAGDEILRSTLLGGPGDDRGLKVAVDAAGAAYVSGWIRSAGSFPVTEGAFQASRPGGWDGTVTKLAADGSTLLYSTYLGGSDDEIAGDIEIDREGNVYVSGLTCSSDFPVTAGVAQPASGGKCDGFVTRLSPDGTNASFSTYFGASGNDEVFEVDVDLDGNVWVTGSTDAPALSTTDDAFQRSVRGPNDAFIAKLSADGELLYRSLIGGDGDGTNGRGHDHVFGFDLDNGGNLRFAGSTRSMEGFPTTVDAFQSAFGGGESDAIFGILSPRRDAFDSEKLIVPVVGSTPGSLGSFFKTGVQLHNPLDQIISGRIVFRPQGSTDKVDETNYYLGPRETLSFPDLLPIMGASGL
ncbi:MAG: SBBP repeat-containing protein, partial [Acidobacteria bacterium]|nr:SBBP repeat-containing protein [Acidobacteriota bacterium]